MWISPYPVVLRNALRILLPLSVVLTAYLYLYPIFLGCAFPTPSSQSVDQSRRGSHSGAPGTAFLETVKLHLPGAVSNSRDTSHRRTAPFRLLALGDPQLEGDTSIPNNNGELFPHLARAVEHITFKTTNLSLREHGRQALHDIVDFWFEDVPNTFVTLRKRLDLFGNDHYLAHIYRSVKWWSVPTHISVLGDLLGSQWIDDDEFERRADRYWNRVMRGAERVPDDVALDPADGHGGVFSGYVGVASPGNATDVWTKRIINVVGNHDIGYAGDITDERLARFERLFGKANYELRFQLPVDSLSPAAAATLYDEAANPDSDHMLPELRIVNLNDMNLDTPALVTDIQDKTYSFINAIINTASPVELKGHFTMVLTHIPLYKPEGICVDSPFFAFHEHDNTLKEQNQLSEDASKGFLEGIFGMHGDATAPAKGHGRKGVILNGHDHEGCDTYHFINQSSSLDNLGPQWETVRWRSALENKMMQANGAPGMREITVRSMMGDFGGNAGLFSAWFDEETWEWRFEFATCPLGKQHFWWAVHVVDLIAMIGVLMYILAVSVERLLGVAVGSPVNSNGIAPGSASNPINGTPALADNKLKTESKSEYTLDGNGAKTA